MPKVESNPVDEWLKGTFGQTEEEMKKAGQEDQGQHQEEAEKEWFDSIEEN